MKPALAFAVIAALWVSVSSIEFQGIAAREAEREKPLEQIAGEAVAEFANPFPLSHPLGYGASVTHSGPGIRKPRARYYTSTTFMEER